MVGVVAASVGLAPTAAPVARKPIALAGTATLAQVNLGQNCRFGGDASELAVACVQSGAFAGKPGRAGASYSWLWRLEIAGGTTTGNGTETGEIAFNFGRRGVLRLTTSGRQVPVGTPAADHARGLTTGTWRFKSGTKQFARRRGTGTYRFETSRTGPDTFQVARLTFRGTLR